MKVTPRADYPIWVRPQYWDEGPDQADLFEGLYIMSLNHTVEISFVPDVSTQAPPWDGRQLAADPADQVATPMVVRLATALVAGYAVTPNATLAGGVERFLWPRDAPEPSSTAVRYVTDDEYARFAGELEHLTTIVGLKFSDIPVSLLRDYEVVRFIECEFVAAPWFAHYDAAILGRGTSAT